MENNPMMEDIYSKASVDDDIEFDENKPWPKPVVCIKSFPRSGTTYLKQNLVLNNFIAIKKRWDLPSNSNQPAPITVLRNLKDCVVSNVVMLNLRTTETKDLKKHIVGSINQYDQFLDSLLLEIDNRVPYLFTQIENNPKGVLDSISSIYSLGLVDNFIFEDKIPVKRYVFNYRTEAVDLFLPSSKTYKTYDEISDLFKEVADLFRVNDKIDAIAEINDKYKALEEIILNKQKALGIQI